MRRIIGAFLIACGLAILLPNVSDGRCAIAAFVIACGVDFILRQRERDQLRRGRS